METILLAMIAKYPIMSSILMAMGLLRAINKPIFALVQAFVDYTLTTSDNEKFEKFKNNAIVKKILWLLDYTASVKLPK